METYEDRVAEMAIENLVQKRTEVRMWCNTLEQCCIMAEDPRGLLSFSKLLREARRELRQIEEVILAVDPNKTGYTAGGAQDDCAWITAQCVAATPSESLFCKVMKMDPKKRGAVQPGGPDWKGVPFTERQFKAMDSNHESIVTRTPYYNEEFQSGPTKGPTPDKGYEAILRAIWHKSDDQKDVYVPLQEVYSFVGPWRNKQGQLTKEADPVWNVFVPVINRMKKQELIHLITHKGSLAVAAKKSRIEFDLDQVTIDDWNVVSNKDKNSVMGYQIFGDWFPRIAVIGNGADRPRPFYGDFAPEQNWSEVNNGRKRREFLSGGIPFYGTLQLCPQVGAEYDKSGKYTLSPDWGKVAISTLLFQVGAGKAKTCFRKGSVEPKKQAYILWPLQREETLKMNWNYKRFQGHGELPDKAKLVKKDKDFVIFELKIASSEVIHLESAGWELINPKVCIYADLI